MIQGHAWIATQARWDMGAFGGCLLLLGVIRVDLCIVAVVVTLHLAEEHLQGRGRVPPPQRRVAGGKGCALEAPRLVLGKGAAWSADAEGHGAPHCHVCCAMAI